MAIGEQRNAWGGGRKIVLNTNDSQYVGHNLMKLREIAKHCSYLGGWGKLGAGDNFLGGGGGKCSLAGEL